LEALGVEMASWGVENKQMSGDVASDVLAALPQAMALAWLFLALASLFSGQSPNPLASACFGLAWLKPCLGLNLA